MAAFFIYSIKVALCLAVFYLFYKLLLSRETFHTFNRIVLLACVALSLLVPVVHVTTSHVSPTININNDITSVIYVISATVIEENKGITWIQLLFAAYIIGVVLFLIAEVVSLLRLWHIIANGHKADCRDGAQVVIAEGNMPPFSWFRWIVVNRHDYEENGCEIITHELAHIRRRHSIDIFLCDLLIVLQWFNPAAWLLKRELQDVHEYEADEVVLSGGVDAEHYQMLLIRKAVGENKFLLANNFNKNSLKKRIKMMSKKKSNPWQRLRAVVLLLLAVVAVSAFARQEVVQIASHIEAESEKMVERIIPNVVDETPFIATAKIAIEDNKKTESDTVKVVSQTENPRGIYRQTKTTVKTGETMKAPLDQYKLSGDSACVMLLFDRPIDKENGIMRFEMRNPDLKAFNYTGDKSKEELGVWIFDSDQDHFTQKWYCEKQWQPWFPTGGWVTEWYDKNVEFSQNAQRVFDGFMKKNPTGKGNLNGVWKMQMQYGDLYYIIGDDYALFFRAVDCKSQKQMMDLRGRIMNRKSNENGNVILGGQEYQVEWNEDDIIKLQTADSTGYNIFKRTPLPPAYKSFFENLSKYVKR